jgi:hypothetical protein
MSYYETGTDGLSSYYETGIDGLGALDAGTSFPSGSEFAIGYTVRGLASSAAPGAVQILRDSVAYGFRGTIVAVQWGPAFGIPSGVMAVKIRTGTALTGAQLNSIASNIGITFQSRLRSAGSASATVTNSHLHQIGGGGDGTSADVASVLSTIGTMTGTIAGATTGMTTPGYPGYMTTGMTPGIDPSTGLPYGTMLPAEEGFFTQSVGGIPMWALIGGGTIAVGAVAYVLMSKPKPAAVKANRRRRSRRNARRGSR